MTRETYRGVRLKCVALKGRDYGRTRVTVGTETFTTAGSEAFNLAWAKRTVDAAAERPDAYELHWHPRAAA